MSQYTITDHEITRLEVIDDTGRVLVFYAGKKGCIQLSQQDEDRTLKVFVRGTIKHHGHEDNH